MHHVDESLFLKGVSGFLGAYYIALAIMNAVMAFALWTSGKARTLFKVPVVGMPFNTAHLWLVVAVFFSIISPLALSGNPEIMKSTIAIPESVRGALDTIMGPTVYTVGTLVILSVVFILRRFFVQPMVAWGVLNLALLVMGMSIIDPDFASIVTKPDNVPIVGMVFLLGFFTWLGAYQAVQNDDRSKRGEPPLEKLDDEKILVWPDLVYTELICMVALTALLLLWGIGLQAPLEEPGSSVNTPNPSKAPWYFLGLQEMLVYYDPWMAGVVLPSLVVFGLMAIPFLDYNKLGNGYYTIDQRKFAYLIFQFGFLVLWVTLIVMGTFMRGPNWNFFGLYETWDPHKVEALNNVDLSEYFWIYGLGQARPKAPDGGGVGTQILYILYREWLGIVLVLAYFIVLPPLMVIFNVWVPKFWLYGQEMGGFWFGFKKFFLKMGFIRYMVMTNLLLFMALLPIKMVCRWVFNMKYFIAVPEYFLNF